MLKSFTSSFAQALQSIRSHFFHTFLSILGIVIGVGALVAILSLIDGMEQYANEQISSTTDLKTIAIRTQTYKEIDNIRIDKDAFVVLNVEDFNALFKSLKGAANGALNTYQSEQISVKDISQKTAAFINATTPLAATDFKIAFGQLFTSKYVQNKDSVAVINIILNFKKCFPEYNNRKLITFFASMNIPNNLIKKLTDIGIYAMMTGDDNMDLVNFEALQK